jgi:predicted DNA-binding transcriptional regulator YafY
MGIPLDVVLLEPANPESEQGYRVRPDRYELADPGLTSEEVAALHLATTQVRLAGGDATAAVWKLGGVPSADVERAATATIPGGDHLEALFGAAAERRPVSFAYRGEERTVDPWRLEFRNGSWYLVGFDHGRGDRRAFRLDRFTGPLAVGAPESFEAPDDHRPVTTRPWEVGDEEPVEVEVRVDADQAAWARLETGAAGDERPDGSVVLRLLVTNRSGLRSWVLGFLDHAELVGPAGERAALVEWLEEIGGARG